MVRNLKVFEKSLFKNNNCNYLMELHPRLDELVTCKDTRMQIKIHLIASLKFERRAIIERNSKMPRLIIEDDSLHPSSIESEAIRKGQ